MLSLKNFFAINTSLALIILSGCGGSSTPAPEAPPPPDKSVIFQSSGKIVAVNDDNTVQVSNTTYDLSSASITMDDQSGSFAELRQGMVVTLKGTRSQSSTTGSETADSLEFEDQVEGPVSSIDVTAGTFVVLGISVQTDSLTIFEGVSMDTMVVGNVVEVSGYSDGNGNVTATYVELEADVYTPGNEIELKGTIASLDSTAMSFLIGSQEVDYSSAILSDIRNDTLVDGLFVEVESTSDLVDGVLIASEIEGKSEGFDGDEGDEVEIEGVVTAFTDSTNFEVNGQAVTTTSTTTYENGTVDNIQLDVRLEAEGELDANGVLVADEIEFKISNDIKIEAPVTAIDMTNLTVTVLGLTVQINELTILKDESDAELPSFSLSDLNDGDFVEIGAMLDGDTIVAGKLERENQQNEVELKGYLDSLAQPDMVVLGVNVITNVDTEFEDAQELPISADTFFSSALVGSLVEVEGTFDGAVLTANEVEMDDD